MFTSRLETYSPFPCFRAFFHSKAAKKSNGP